jgi:hypothetical protein
VKLVSLDMAKSHLRVSAADDDLGINFKIEQASHILLDYIKKRDPEVWDQTRIPSESESDSEFYLEPVPFLIEAATLLILEALYDGHDPLSQPVKDLLHRYRDPALA